MQELPKGVGPLAARSGAAAIALLALPPGAQQVSGLAQASVPELTAMHETPGFSPEKLCPGTPRFVNWRRCWWLGHALVRRPEFEAP